MRRALHMRHPIAPFGPCETLRPNLRVLHGMIHCADESLGLHGHLISDASRAATTLYLLSLDGRTEVRLPDIFLPHSNSLPPWGERTRQLLLRYFTAQTELWLCVH